MFSADADDQCCGNVRRGRELERRRSQINSMIGRNLSQFSAFFDIRGGDSVGVLSVVVPRTPGNESGVQR